MTVTEVAVHHSCHITFGSLSGGGDRRRRRRRRGAIGGGVVSPLYQFWVGNLNTRLDSLIASSSNPHRGGGADDRGGGAMVLLDCKYSIAVE